MGLGGVVSIHRVQAVLRKHDINNRIYVLAAQQCSKPRLLDCARMWGSLHAAGGHNTCTGNLRSSCILFSNLCAYGTLQNLY